MTRQALRLLLAALGVIVLVRFVAIGAAAGPTWLPGTPLASPTLDSEFRFLSVLGATAGILLLWLARAPERSPALLHLLLGVTLAGGLIRLYSGLAVGWPEGPAVPATVIELIVPLVGWALWWRAKA